MPKTFPIMIEVEEAALGSVLRKLNEMPGIAKLHLDMGRGGEGAGKEKLERQARALAPPRRTESEAAAIKLLLTGPQHIKSISEVVGGKIGRAYNTMSSLKRQGFVEPAAGHGMHQLTKGAAARLKSNGHADGGAAKPLALPSPTASGRASKGSSTLVLRAALDGGLKKTPAELRAVLVMSGLSGKGVSGALARGKRDGIVKKVGDTYELTAKGQKLEPGAIANG